MIGSEAMQPSLEIALTQIGATFDDGPRGFTPGV